MILSGIKDLTTTDAPLELIDTDIPEPTGNELLLKITASGVCHTELDEIEGRTPPSRFPMILGHQVVGHITSSGPDAARHAEGERVGVAWIYDSCGTCQWCRTGLENLCPDFRATGRDAFGGYAEFMVVPEESVYPIPDVFTDVEASPLLCAGAIGYRSLRLAEIRDGQALGLTGFGASAHLVLKMVRQRYPDTRIYIFARSPEEREFALDLGAIWAGDTTDESPEKLHAVIDTTPVWKPVVEALKNLHPNGRLVINAIRKEDHDKNYLLRLEYPRDLWMEKEIKSVANVARSDVSEFLKLAAEIPIKPDTETFVLEDANTALMELKQRKIRGAKVLIMGE